MADGQYRISDIQSAPPPGGSGAYRLADAKPVAAPQRTLHNDSAGKPKPGTPHSDEAIPDSGVMGALFTPVRGVQQISKGVQRMGKPEDGETLGGISDVIQGAAKVVTPYAPGVIAAAPVAAIAGATGAAVGSKVAGATAEALDASPGAQELAQTGGEVLGGGIAAKYGPAALEFMAAPAKKAAQHIISTLEDPLVRDAVGIASPRLGKLLDTIYGAKKIVNGVQAARAAQPPPAPVATQPAPVPEAPVTEASPVSVPPTAPGIGGGGPLRPPLAAPTESDALTLKLNKLLRDTKTEAGLDPDVPLGEVKGAHYQNRFGSDGPVIDSSKRRVGSTAEIANPGKILTKKAFRDSLPENSPLLKGDAFEKAYKLAVELKLSGSNLIQMKGTQ